MKEHQRNAIKTSLPKSRGTQAITPKRFLQRSASREGQSAKRPKSVYEVLQSPGQPLERTTRTWMEQRFGHDFSRVRVHTDKRAADSAREMNANAYTVGSNIVFAEGQYRPEQQSGKELLAHELTHTLQLPQGAGAIQAGSLLQVSPADSWDERGAERTAQSIMSGATRGRPAAELIPHSASSSVQLHRQAAPSKNVNLPEINLNTYDFQSLLDAVHLIQQVQYLGNGEYSVSFQGKIVIMSQVQVDLFSERIKLAADEALRKIEERLESARALEQKFKTTLQTYIEIFGRLKEAGSELMRTVGKAQTYLEETRQKFKDKNFLEAARMIADGEIDVGQVQKNLGGYWEEVTTQGKDMISDFESARDMTEQVVSGIGDLVNDVSAVSAKDVMNWGASQLNGELLSANASFTASFEAGLKFSLNENVNWSVIGTKGVGVLSRILISLFKDKLTDHLVDAVMRQSGLNKAGRDKLERLVSATLSQASGTSFMDAVNTVYIRLIGKELSWNTFVEQLVEELLDPKGWFVAKLDAELSISADARFSVNGGPLVNGHLSASMEGRGRISGRFASSEEKQEVPQASYQPASQSKDALLELGEVIGSLSRPDSKHMKEPFNLQVIQYMSRKYREIIQYITENGLQPGTKAYEAYIRQELLKERDYIDRYFWQYFSHNKKEAEHLREILRIVVEVEAGNSHR